MRVSLFIHILSSMKMHLSLRFSCLWLFAALVTVEVLAGDTDGAPSIVIKLKEGGTQEDVNTILQRHPQYVMDKQVCIISFLFQFL